ncbi:Bilirubin oxidase [Paramyrothecium foliicola]|nr:Bilirubin oxidase [Paramyrothecium foliicola]
MYARSLGAVALGLLFSSQITQASPISGTLQKRVSQISPHLPLYAEPLPIPPVKQPRFTTTNPVTGKEIWYYEIEIKPFTRQVYADLGPAHQVGYDGIAPGPTFQVPRGVETVVRFVNRAETSSSIHLHGSYSRAAWDGWAEDMTEPGQYKDYYYPNSQSARTLWYHDHAMHITAENAYRGQAGLYVLTDPAEDALGLPSGYGEFDIPIILTSAYYAADGSLVTTKGENFNFWGDVILVVQNGQPWPFFNVEPRKYRFRFLDAAVSRAFGLYFTDSSVNSTTRIPFKVVASDAGLLEQPVELDLIYVSMAERYEVVFDFSDFAGKTIDLRNIDGGVNGIGVEVDYENTDKVLRFHVAEAVSEPDTSVVPANLREVPFPAPTSMTPRIFDFGGVNFVWTINHVRFSDVENRLLANVPLGTVERWELINIGDTWTHPVHIHLIDFKIISRTSGNGARTIEPYESGLKDVVWLGRRETVVVEAHYAPHPGLYMFHCHNLIHEDNDMMAAFNVTVLENHGYNASAFVDPMDSRWRARPFQIADFQAQSGEFSIQAITERIHTMAEFQPYAEANLAAE